jgi:hypothetical protein
MALSTSNVNLIIDHLCRVYARALGVAGSTSYGIGDAAATDRAQGSAEDLLAALVATGDTAILAGSNGLLDVATRWTQSLTAVRVARNSEIMSRLQRQISALGLAGVATLDQYLTYYNYGAGGTNTALQSPYWRALHFEWCARYPTARNLYFAILSGGTFEGTTYANGLRKLIVGTGQTAGASVSTDYAGGVPHVLASGTSGSGLVTVTGTEYNPATGTRTAGKTWTVTVNANGAFALASGGATPASANALIVAVSDITAAAGLTAGTVVAEARAPSGRLAVPF